MLEFKSIDKKRYSVPELFIRKHGGYFELISGGTIPMTSCQIDFLFFDVDRFDQDSFVQSIPVFLQFSIHEFNQKVLCKIEKLINNHIPYTKYGIEPLLDLLAYSIDENSTLNDLKKILEKYIESIWMINQELITSRFLLLEKELDKKEYFMTLYSFDETILDCFGNQLKFYFECDAFVFHLLDHYVLVHFYYKPQKIINALLSYSSIISIQYWIKHTDFTFLSYINTFSFKYPIHYVCERSLPELIVLFIEKDSHCTKYKDGNKKTAAHYICEYSTLEMLKYIIQNSKNIALNRSHNGYCPHDYLPDNKNEDMITFLKEIEFDPDQMDLEDIKIRMNW